MKKYTKTLALLLALTLCLSLLAACGSKNNDDAEDSTPPVVESTPVPETTSIPETTPLPETDVLAPVETVTTSPSPSPKPSPKPSTSPSPSPSPAASSVDLQAFFDKVTSEHEFPSLDLAEGEALDRLYTGLSGISTKQRLVYINAMGMNTGEFALVQAESSDDVAAVKAALQARIDYMVGDGNGPGGAFYPMAMDQWENNSRLVSNGNYVMLVVHDDCDSIVSAFNALFD